MILSGLWIPLPHPTVGCPSGPMAWFPPWPCSLTGWPSCWSYFHFCSCIWPPLRCFLGCVPLVYLTGQSSGLMLLLFFSCLRLAIKHWVDFEGGVQCMMMSTTLGLFLMKGWSLSRKRVFSETVPRCSFTWFLWDIVVLHMQGLWLGRYHSEMLKYSFHPLFPFSVFSWDLSHPHCWKANY